jgi:hypothetical protein
MHARNPGSPQVPTRHSAGAVSRSRFINQTMACEFELPHMSCAGCSPPQNAGRSGRPKIRQRFASSSCTHRTPAGLPCGMPGIGELIEGAMQHAPQPLRHSMLYFL